MQDGNVAKPKNGKRWVWFGVAVALGLLVGGGIAYVLTMEAKRQRPPSEAGYRSSAERFRQIEQGWIHYKQTDEIAIDLPDVSAFAVGSKGDIYIAGGEALLRITQNGAEQRFPLQKKSNVVCLAVGAAGETVYLGYPQAVHLYSAEGEYVDAWHPFNDDARITGIAAGEDTVYVADAGNREVVRLSAEGDVRGKINGEMPQEEASGFVIPSLYFDVALGEKGGVWITNPGKHTVQKYTGDGEFVRRWGKASAELEGFSGCCNPVYIVSMPDGKLATSEKGIKRVKTYTATGKLQSVVIPPAHYAEDTPPYEIAAGFNEQILALDKNRGIIRLFNKNPNSGEKE